MSPNPFLGVFLHALGGFAAGSFYIPYKKVRGWAWETYWLTGGFFSWIIAPWIVGALTCPGLLKVLLSASPRTEQDAGKDRTGRKGRARLEQELG